MEGMLNGNTFVYATGGHARAIVGMVVEGEDLKLLLVDPLDAKPTAKKYSIEEIVNGSDNLPPLDLFSEFFRITRTDINAVDMNEPIRLEKEELPIE